MLCFRRWGCSELEQALLQHSLSNLLEASDVSASDQVVAQAVLLSSLSRDSVDVLHHLLQLAVDLQEGQWVRGG